jgi:alkylation response protein AidB-like acyl-CoA dehydrogenase
VWSSYADGADFGLLLARTSSGAPTPHSALTMFILPMTARGVSVRPLVDITGGRHFNEVFLSDAPVADDLVLGDVDGGWGVATGTLGGERSGYLGGSGNGRRHRQVVAIGRAYGRFESQVARDAAAVLVTEERILEWLRDRTVEGCVCSGSPAAGSMIKLAAGSLEQKVSEFNFALAGISAAAWEAGELDGDTVAHAVCASRQATIAGGTHQIQRNLLAERVLRLPRK